MVEPVAPRALVVDDDDVLARSLVDALLGADPPWRAEGVASLAAAEARLADRDVDVILLDLLLPDGNGLALIPAARAAGVPVVVLSVLGDERTVYAALTLGAAGYLLKPEGVPVAAKAAEDAMAGGAPISPRIARWIVDELVRGGRLGGDAQALTEREREVLRQFATGATYAEAARSLGVSVNTVRQYVRAIYEKLHVTTKTEAVLKGLAGR